MHDFKCLVLSGGANRGIAFGGALQVLERHKLLKNVNCFVGTSIGALIAGLLAVHYTADEIVETTFACNLQDFKPDSTYPSQLSNLLYRYGRFSTEKMEILVNNLLQKHFELPEITFKQLYEFVGSTLMVTACCINSGHTEYLSHLTVPDMPVYQAICMSMCIPLEFEPYTMENMLYCDGGMFGHNLPREFPEHKNFGLELENHECLALSLDRQFDLKIVNSGMTFASALWNGFQTALGNKCIFKHCVSLICDVPMLSSKISHEDKKMYILQAREITEKWVELN